ncbi:hypothetical protein CHARACLAT_025864 [Characodon lateralis]|uniref:Uncharacterized protein n=1 Tax=Characodon lateralis TaxID=208331 RepID=A0ABU7E5F9_9TELE|nr:hypothetical protein [Characodon lateralis]
MLLCDKILRNLKTFKRNRTNTEKVCFCLDLCLLVCGEFSCHCPGPQVSSRQLEAEPEGTHRSPVKENMGTLKKKKLSITLQEHGSASLDIHSVMIRGFTSP